MLDSFEREIRGRDVGQAFDMRSFQLTEGKSRGVRNRRLLLSQDRCALDPDSISLNVKINRFALVLGYSLDTIAFGHHADADLCGFR